MPQMTVSGTQLLRDGSPHRILSGALHYFRVHPEQWARQLRMLHSMGLNTVETYVPWNFHERDEGTYDFTGIADLERFVALAADEGLDVIVRPGPYICAEWENGGLPAWLTARTGRRLRCTDQVYLAAVDRWFDELVPRVAALQHTHGGPVCMVQVENEYGSYGSDAAYLEHLRDGLVARGIDVPLFTSDGDEDWMLVGGTLPDVLATVNFGSRAARAFGNLDRFRPGQPRICMEFWDGWFDHWGEDHTVREPADAATALREILESDGSVNLYMAQGGTSFGPWAGANRGGPLHDGELQPTITSYDYDAPIDERGEPTETFWRFRDVLLEHRRTLGDTTPVPEVPAPTPVLDEAEVPLAVATGSALAAAPATWSAAVPTLEDLGVDQGVAIHTTVLRGPRAALPLRVTGVADRLAIYVDGRLAAAGAGPEVSVDLPPVPAGGPGLRVDLVVESLGRVNYGPCLGERKGITGQVTHERQVVHGFSSRAVRLDDLDELAPWDPADAPLDAVAPLALTGTFRAGRQADTRVAVDGVGRGVAFVNGFCLGRFDAAGPQTSLYVPWPLVREGENDVTVVVQDPRDGVGPVARARLVRGTGFRSATTG